MQLTLGNISPYSHLLLDSFRQFFPQAMKTEDSTLAIATTKHVVQTMWGTTVGSGTGIWKNIVWALFLVGQCGVATTPAHHKPQPEGGVQPALQLEPQCVKPHLQWDGSQCLLGVVVGGKKGWRPLEASFVGCGTVGGGRGAS